MHTERTEREDAFSHPGGLPYDEGQTVPLPLDPPSHQRPIDDLDRPLDDLIEESAPPRRTHGRSRGMRSDGEVEYVPQPRGDEGGWKPTQKLYLLSEVDATVHHRMASDALDQDLGDRVTNDISSLPQPPVEDPLVRANALYFEGRPLTELPTDKVFTYITSFSTSLPLGVEWISDDRLVVVFPSKISAASALNSLLADPTSPSILSALSTVLSSSATSSSFDADLPLVDVQPVPTHLWPVELRPVVARLRMDADEGGAVDPSDGGPMKEVLRVRWARSGDKKAARKTKPSSFYEKYGSSAGKPRNAPDRTTEGGGDDILSSTFAFDRERGSRRSEEGGRWGHRRDRSRSPDSRHAGRTLAQRMRRSASPGRGEEGEREDVKGRGMRSDRAAELDADLERLSRGERGESRRDGGAGGRGRGGGGGQRREGGGESRRTEARPKRDADDLDRELEAFLAQRS